ncbi:hypothetical protein E1262_13630 [Jiangella aurantiaca]|uniref:DUF5317 domain-containing protein n=1 Tax=Jiangella aurantiaca TaxID=2530373 RepID=A0A4R5ACU6_9ACTN|nr:DUF5317 domain-containing protein [Jiangella aurantiaca]TDD69070.1 hypothetical protein E1262_13630 [Jiangella aurantiaca]
MALLLLALVAGLAAGYARGGRLRRLGERPPVRSRLILTALGAYAVGVAGSWVWEPLLPAMTALCWFTLGFYAWLNRAYHGARLIALGLAANGLVILLNGGMPVSVSAEQRAGVEVTAAERPDEGVVTVAGDDTRLRWLGKTIPVAFPPRPEAVSPGDIAVAAGVAAALATAMTGRRTAAARERAEAPRRPQRRPAERAGQRPRPSGPPPPPEPATGRATMDDDATAGTAPESPRVTA